MQKYFENNPFSIWYQSLLLIYPQSELPCATFYTTTLNKLYAQYLPTSGAPRFVFSRVKF